MAFLQRNQELEALFPEGKRFFELIKEMYLSYRLTTNTPFIDDEIEEIYEEYQEKIARQVESPYLFESFHKAVPGYLEHSMEVMRRLVIWEKSKCIGKENLREIATLLEKGENVILLANHQIEPDPQILHLFLEGEFDSIRKQLAFVAGDRVTTDAVAVPFSLGCNLFCIYSKRRIDFPPERKEEKLLHNQRTMGVMREKLSEGGWCIYVAPSGGRDRKNQNGEVEVTPFSPSSVEMLYLTSKRSSKKTHFFPLALSTYELLPPPPTIDIEVGELRRVFQSPAGIAVGQEIDMEQFDSTDKKAIREIRSHGIFNEVMSLYRQLR